MKNFKLDNAGKAKSIKQYRPEYLAEFIVKIAVFRFFMFPAIYRGLILECFHRISIVKNAQLKAKIRNVIEKQKQIFIMECQSSIYLTEIELKKMIQKMAGAEPGRLAVVVGRKTIRQQ